jgi:hypothetical protein
MPPIALHKPATVRSGGLAKERLEPGEGIFDRVEARAAEREEEKPGAGGLDQRADLGPLVAGEVVHDDDVAVPELRNEDAFDLGLEGVSVDRTREHEGREHTAQAQCGDDGGGLPVAMRDADPQALSPRGAAMGSRHVGLRPGLVDEDQPLGIEVGLGVKPGLPVFQDIGTILLAGVRGLFLRVIR